MRVLVIGGYGHIGRFLVPKLVDDGHDVIVATRGRNARPETAAWPTHGVQHVACDYDELAKPASGKELLAEMAPDALIDILGRSVLSLAANLSASVEQMVVCGSLWMFGPPWQVPTPEVAQARCPFDLYQRRFEELQQLLADAGNRSVTGVMPSNIAGPGKIPLEPMAGRDVGVHRSMAAGKPVVLPGDGSTLVGPADAEDIAEVFRLVVANREQAAGRLFNASAAYAITFNRMVEAYGEIYGKQLKLSHMDWPTYQRQFGTDQSVRYHHEQHMCADINPARTLLGYEPAHTPEQALERAVQWMRDGGMLDD